MVSTPGGPRGQDDYFDRNKFNKMQEIYRQNLGRDMSASDMRQIERRNPRSLDEVRAYVESKKPAAKPTPSAAKTKPSAAKKPAVKPAAQKPTPKKK